jgi:predicted permease
MTSPLLALRVSIRQLRKSPGFALTAILTLALGIGAAVSVFSVVDAVLLKPFAFRDPGRLTVMREVVDEMRSQYPAVPFNYRHFLRLKKDSKTLEDAAIFQEHGASVSSAQDHPHIVGAVAVSQNFLPLLGVQPAMGRNFLPEELTEGHASVVILSWEGWQSLLNGDANVIGRTMRVGGEVNTIVGVLPQGFRFPEIPMAPNMPSRAGGDILVNEVFHPLVPDKNSLIDDSYDYNYSVIARLRAGVTVAQARAELESLQRAYSASAHLEVHDGIYIEPFAKDVTSNVSSGLWLLFAAIGCVLLIACVNLANLQLARAVATERESAVRAALGASRTELLLSRLMESLVLASVGGVAGIALAFFGVRLLVAFAPADVPRLNEVQVNLPVLCFAAGLSIFTALLFGMLPALRSLQVNPQSALQANPSRVVNTRASSATRNLLVAGEVACTVVLLIVTGLVLRSFSQVLRQNRGFDADHVTAAQVNLYSPQYSDAKSDSEAAKSAFIERTLTALRQIPGVQSAAMTSAMPLTGETWIDVLTRPDHPVPSGQEPKVNVRFVSPGFLATMHIPLLAGRALSDSDRNVLFAADGKPSKAPVPILITEKLAHDAFPGEDPVGRLTRAFGDQGDGGRHNIVAGVVADARVNGLRNSADMLYVPYWYWPPWNVTFLVRSSQPGSAVIPSMRRVIWQIDPQVAIPALKSLDDQMSESLAGDRFQTLLLSAFGAGALLLALLGVYGVMAYSVSLRQQEFGIRIALGSDKGRLMALVLRQAAWPVLAGAAAGMVLAGVAVRAVRSLLFETQLLDPVAITGSLVLLIFAAALAAVLPARRASRVDPVEVLRTQ